ncbi:hypothetical protein, partial [Hominenteromicrobium sp.]|uniref:hypothetical protein n=1 Tax=Hominenteromicrobium sp. TaxID=3073581 RepID=UPI003AF1242B
MEGDIKGFRKKVIVYQISIHALRVEGDEADLLGHLLGDISIHALRVEGDSATSVEVRADGTISTRALRVEGDGRAGFFLPKASRISIRALRVEGDPALFRLPISFPNFYPR